MHTNIVNTNKTDYRYKEANAFCRLNLYLNNLLKKKIFYTKPLICLSFIVILGINSFSDTIFVDYFSNEPVSFKNWKPISTHENMFTIENNGAKLNNQDDIFCGFALYKMNQSLSEFTFSASISARSPGAGLFFCISQTTGFFSGYAVIIGYDALYLLKYNPDGVKIEKTMKTPFIKPDSNKLQISRNGNLCNTFCNGYFSGSFTISENGSDFALIVQPSTEAIFDNIVIENRFKDSTSSECFYDDFSTKNSFGWSVTEFAQNTRTDTAFIIKTKNRENYFSFVPIPLNNFNIKAISSLQNLSDTILFGIYLRVNKIDSISNYLFGICGDNNYITGFSEGLVKKGNNLMEYDTVLIFDTLEIKNEDNTFSFSANGNIIKSCNIYGDVLGAGIFVSENLEVHFYEFSLQNLCDNSENEETVYTTSEHTSNINELRISDSKRCFDLLGRTASKTAKFKKTSGIIVEAGIKRLIRGD